MTTKELNNVRDLNNQIRNLERRLNNLRISVQNITPVIDGLPHSNEIKSRVEKIALKIVDDERELANLRAQLPPTKAHLAETILSEVADPLLQTLLILRYVACHSYNETAHLMHVTLRHVFKLHNKALKEGIGGHIDAQKQS